MITYKPPNYPFVTINSNGSPIGNHGIAALQEGGIVRGDGQKDIRSI